MVNEKQQLINPSSLGAVSKIVGPGVAAPAPCVIVGLNCNTHDVKRLLRRVECDVTVFLLVD